jgi:Fe-S cluster assembly protein SufD
VQESPAPFISATSRRSEANSHYAATSSRQGRCSAAGRFGPRRRGGTALNGIFLTNGRQHVGNHPTRHAKPHFRATNSLKVSSTAPRPGRSPADRRPSGAQKTDAISRVGTCSFPTTPDQSRSATGIYADDVRCTHGATVGQLDEDALFLPGSEASIDSAKEPYLRFRQRTDRTHKSNRSARIWKSSSRNATEGSR